MKRIRIFLLFVSVLLLAGCSDDDRADNKENQESVRDEMTSFVGSMSGDQSMTRTSIASSGEGGLGLKWTWYDDIWIKRSIDPKGWIKNYFKEAAGKQLYLDGRWPTRTATFLFKDRLTEESYPVRYTGEGSTSPDKVTIRSEQDLYWVNPTASDRSFSIGANGDCGVAVARKDEASGRYKFQLEHKAAYIGIAPYSGDDKRTSQWNNFELKSIKVSTDDNQAICGTFDFDDNGIVLSSRPAATEKNRVISSRGCQIPTLQERRDSWRWTDHHVVLVIAPGTYKTIRVIYVVGDPYDYDGTRDVTLGRTYFNVTFRAGKIRWIRPNFVAGGVNGKSTALKY